MHSARNAAVARPGYPSPHPQAQLSQLSLSDNNHPLASGAQIGRSNTSAPPRAQPEGERYGDNGEGEDEDEEEEEEEEEGEDEEDDDDEATSSNNEDDRAAPHIKKSSVESRHNIPQAAPTTRNASSLFEPGRQGRPQAPLHIPSFVQNLLHPHPHPPPTNSSVNSQSQNVTASSMANSHNSKQTYLDNGTVNVQAVQNIIYLPSSSDDRSSTINMQPPLTVHTSTTSLGNPGSRRKGKNPSSPTSPKYRRDSNRPNMPEMRWHSDPLHFSTQDTQPPQKPVNSRPEPIRSAASDSAIHNIHVRPRQRTHDIGTSRGRVSGVSFDTQSPGRSIPRQVEGVQEHQGVQDSGTHRKQVSSPVRSYQQTRDGREREGYSSPAGTRSSEMAGISSNGNQGTTSRRRPALFLEGHDGYPSYDDTQFMSPTSSGSRPSALEVIPEGQHANVPSATATAPNLEPLGNPWLAPFKNRKGDEWILKNVEEHIPAYIRSDILDEHSEAIPLWYPRPLLIGTDGRMRALEVGDLVYVSHSGEVRVFFNVFRSYAENLDAGAQPPPEPCEPLQIENFADFVREVDIQKQRCYFSDNVERLKIKPSSKPNEMRYEFTTRKQARDGAIMVLPHGGVHHSLRNNFFQLPKVKYHFRSKARAWYQHARTIRPKLENGSLLLVRGTYHARTWGIASFSSKNYVKVSIEAEFRQNGLNPHEYIWAVRDNRWKTKVGPSSAEMEVLQGQEPPLNQCIGVVLSSLWLDDMTWHTLLDPNSLPPTLDKGKKSTSTLKARSSSSGSHVSGSQSERSLWSRLSRKNSFKGNSKQSRRSSSMQEAGLEDYALLIQES